MNKLELRMYGLVPYNISPIQQGIQFGHAVVEYGLKFNDEKYLDWANNYKTFIILNGGTTNNNPNSLGTLNKYANSLDLIGINNSKFYEPDLGDQLTSVVFIVDERVFNREKYPDYVKNSSNFISRNINHYNSWKKQFYDTDENVKQIISLREILSNLRLA